MWAPWRMLESDHDAFIVELRALEGLLKRHCSGPRCPARILKRVEKFIRHFEGHMDSHFKAEEMAVFPHLRRHAPRLSPTLLYLIAEHRAILKAMAAWKRSFKKAKAKKSATDQGTALGRQGLKLVRLLRAHVVKESGIMSRFTSQ